MKRRRWVVVIAFAVLLLGAAGWWWYDYVPPLRPPEIVGVVQAVEPHGSDSRFLVTMLDSPPAELGYWVVTQRSARIRQRKGGPGKVAVGQSVSVWHRPFIKPSNPAIVYAEWVVIDAPTP